MNSERGLTTLGEVVTLKRGYDLPAADRRGGVYPIVSSSGISGSHDEAKAKAPGVVTGRYGTIGELFYVDSDYWPLNTALYVKDFKGNVPRYIYYFLHSIGFEQFSDKSGVPGVNRNHLHAIEVNFEKNTNIQRAVATILGDLDDKIKSLQDMNGTLEEITRTIFRAWFVDFAPVRAKAAGATTFPSMPQEVFDTLPKSFEHSEIGTIPKGWQVRRLSQVLELAYGKSLPSSARTAGEIAVYGSGGLTGSHNEKLVEGPAVIIGRKGTIGTIFWEDKDVFPIDTVFYLVSKQAPLIFLYHFLQSLSLPSMNTDAAVPGLNRNNVYRIEVAWPKDDLIDAYVQLITNKWLRRSGNLREIHILTTLRDTLLPKLISGELPVPDLAKLGPREAGNGG